MSKYVVIGRHGLLGGAIAKHLGDVGSFPTDDTKVIFHFGSYTHRDFEKNPHYLMKQTLDSFSMLLPLCAERGMTFVYPSSALVYEKSTVFTRFKRALEDLAAAYDVRSIGCRLFPVYGPGENRSVISKWCEAMAKGERPIVYGDGSQSRDFIHVYDAVRQILSHVHNKHTNGVIDIGAGKPATFNSIIRIINETLSTDIPPRYVDAPLDYSRGIACQRPGPTSYSLETGIQSILSHFTPAPSVARLATQ